MRYNFFCENCQHLSAINYFAKNSILLKGLALNTFLKAKWQIKPKAILGILSEVECSKCSSE